MNANKIKRKRPEMISFSYFLSLFSFALIRVDSRLILSDEPQYLIHDLQVRFELKPEFRSLDRSQCLHETLKLHHVFLGSDKAVGPCSFPDIEQPVDVVLAVAMMVAKG